MKLGNDHVQGRARHHLHALGINVIVGGLALQPHELGKGCSQDGKQGENPKRDDQHRAFPPVSGKITGRRCAELLPESFPTRISARITVQTVFSLLHSNFPSLDCASRCSKTRNDSGEPPGSFRNISQKRWKTHRKRPIALT